MDKAISVTVPTGTKSEYRFIKRNGLTNPYVEVQIAPEGSDKEGTHYHSFEGRAATALLHLVERAHELEKFFHATEQIAITEYFGGRLTSFIERDDLDPNDEEDKTNYEAYELVAQMVEERRAEEDERLYRRPKGGKFIRDED